MEGRTASPLSEVSIVPIAGSGPSPVKSVDKPPRAPATRICRPFRKAMPAAL
jgi:hypothetical protein